MWRKSWCWQATINRPTRTARTFRADYPDLPRSAGSSQQHLQPPTIALSPLRADRVGQSQSQRSHTQPANPQAASRRERGTSGDPPPRERGHFLLSTPGNPHRPLHRPHHYRLRCFGSAVCFSRYTTLATAATRPALALPSRSHMHVHIPPWLIIVHLYYYHGPLWPATTHIRQPMCCVATNAPCPDTPCRHVPHWRLYTKRVRPGYCIT